MKKYFAAILGVCLIITGLFIPDSFADLDYDIITVYEKGIETVYTADERLPSTRGKYVRADLTGDADRIMERLKAVELYREEVGGSTVIYGFSPRFAAYEILRGQRVNVMLAVNGDKIAVGSPLLKGSF